MKNLSVKQKQYLKGYAHNLNPVVTIGDKGLTSAVLKEIKLNLSAHELIKIRVLGDDRELRLQLIDEICHKTECHFVQHIGKLIVVYKANDKKKKINLVNIK